MDPRKLFCDERLLGVCVYCGGSPDTRDHVPSRVLLDEPFPPQISVVECCGACNASFALDEQYLACFIECVIAGSTAPERIARPKIARILSDTPRLAKRIAAAEQRGYNGEQIWLPEQERVDRVVLKLARGHAAYELSILEQLDAPEVISCVPLQILQESVAQEFLSPQPTPFWPEVGSRAFIRACKNWPDTELWQVVQPGRYQYLVSQDNGLAIRMLLSDYLACEVRWA